MPRSSGVEGLQDRKLIKKRWFWSASMCVYFKNEKQNHNYCQTGFIRAPLFGMVRSFTRRVRDNNKTRIIERFPNYKRG
jgi:hypothetical protein